MHTSITAYKLGVQYFGVTKCNNNYSFPYLLLYAKQEYKEVLCFMYQDCLLIMMVYFEDTTPKYMKNKSLKYIELKTTMCYFYVIDIFCKFSDPIHYAGVQV